MKASVDSSACNNEQRQNKDKCRKKLVDKLGKDCAGNIHEVKMEKITSAEYENGHKYECTLYIVLFQKSLQSTLELVLILFTTNT